MSDTAYGDIMDNLKKAQENYDEDWGFFEHMSVKERFKELYKRVEFLEKQLSKNADSCTVRVQGIDFDTKLPKDSDEPKGCIEDGIDLV